MVRVSCLPERHQGEWVVRRSGSLSDQGDVVIHGEGCNSLASLITIPGTTLAVPDVYRIILYVYISIYASPPPKKPCF